MEDDWENAANKEVVIRAKTTNDINKWEGEDDDEDVKDSWEDEEEKKDEEKIQPKPSAEPVKAKPHKILKGKLAEQERLEEEAELKRLSNMTPEEKVAEKLRLLEIQKESDLKSALETFGVLNIPREIDSINPQSKEEFKEYGAALSWKILQHKESPHFTQFVEELVRSLCVNLTSADMKKVKMTIENLYTEKLKLEKQHTKKPAGKGKVKATLRTEANDIEGYQKYGNDYDDYDDFM